MTDDTQFAQMIHDLTQKFTALWWESDRDPTLLKRIYARHEQREREAHLRRFMDMAGAEIEQPPYTMAERASAEKRGISAFRDFASTALDFEEQHLDALLHGGFPEAGVKFVQAARRFDPALSGMDIFQASRNAWTMNGLQRLLGVPLQVTPAVLAYSLLYPYSDNYLDDPALSAETKAAFNTRFARRLRGECVTPINDRERAICELIGMIEQQYDRAAYPRVYASMLAIHRAQVKSLRQLRHAASPYEMDVLGISFEKGGASVLADGYLVAGDLTAPQAEFIFGWGTFVQLADDLQDLGTDLRNGAQTIFTQTARRWNLDGLTARLFRYGARVLEGLDCFDASGLEPFKEVMHRSAVVLVLDAVAPVTHLHSRGYIRELEMYSPFRFVALRKLHREIARKREPTLRFMEAYIGGEVAGHMNEVKSRRENAWWRNIARLWRGRRWQRIFSG